MQIVCISDIHGYLPEIPECDLLIVAGDVCPDEDIHKQRLFLRGEFADWLDAVPAQEKVWIAGNHDFVCEQPGFNRIAKELPGHYLQDTSVELLGIKIHGTPWVPNLPGWAFYMTDSQLRAVAKVIPEDTDILIAHGPPYKLGDCVRPNIHVGSVPLATELSYRINPKLVVCGHIHEDYGIHEYRDRILINAAHLDGAFEPVNKPIKIELGIGTESLDQADNVGLSIISQGLKRSFGTGLLTFF